LDAVAALGRELARLQAAQSEFAAMLAGAGTRGALADVKARVEGHQAHLAAWEERVRAQLEAITELQSPSRRTLMLGVGAGDGIVGLRSSVRTVSGDSVGAAMMTARLAAPPAASAPVSPVLWSARR
jgi:hypothetical protein